MVTLPNCGKVLVRFSHEISMVRLVAITTTQTSQRMIDKVVSVYVSSRLPQRRRSLLPTYTACRSRADWQLRDERDMAEILISERIAGQIERHFGRCGEIRFPAREHSRARKMMMSRRTSTGMLTRSMRTVGIVFC